MTLSKNIETAHKIGFSTHHFTSPTLLKADLQQLGILQRSRIQNEAEQ